MIPAILAGQTFFGGSRAASNQSLLLHFNGTNGSTSFIDSSASARTPDSINGGAVLSTSVKRFGSASLACLGIGDFVTYANWSGFNFGSGDYTVRFWFNFDAVLSQNQLLDLRGGSSALPILYVVGGQLRMYQDLSDQILGGTIVDDTWYFVEMTRASGVVSLYLDGVRLGTYSTSSSISVTPSIGSVNGLRNCNGWIDDFEILKGEGYSGATRPVPTNELPTRG